MNSCLLYYSRHGIYLGHVSIYSWGKSPKFVEWRNTSVVLDETSWSDQRCMFHTYCLTNTDQSNTLLDFYAYHKYSFLLFSGEWIRLTNWNLRNVTQCNMKKTQKPSPLQNVHHDRMYLRPPGEVESLSNREHLLCYDPYLKHIFKTNLFFIGVLNRLQLMYGAPVFYMPFKSRRLSWFFSPHTYH
jgi:hypothetical protein